MYTGEILAILFNTRVDKGHKTTKDSCLFRFNQFTSQSLTSTAVLLETQQTLFTIQNMGLIVIFLWIPAHIGTNRTETADEIARRQ